MIFRLLYRLFLQRVNQSRRKQRLPQTTPSLAMSYQHQAINPEYKSRVSKGLFVYALILAVFLALGWRFFEFSPSGMEANVNHAELRLDILSSSTWPSLVYLQGKGLRQPETSPGPSQINRIESINGTFAPAFQVLPAGSTIEIINSDTIAHNTHVFNRGDTIFNVALPLPGIIVEKSLTGSGIFNVRCDLHPWMQAWLFVPPNQHYAVLQQPDSVNFSNLPPGQYILHQWQADRPEQIRLINLGVGEAKTLRLH